MPDVILQRLSASRPSESCSHVVLPTLLFVTEYRDWARSFAIMSLSCYEGKIPSLFKLFPVRKNLKVLFLFPI